MKWIARVLIGCACWYPALAPALGPHELLLLVNRDSPRSLELANHYAHLRQIPPANIVHLSLPATATDPSARITREEFTRTIWEPAQAAVRDRRLGDHILAWAYSADFPVLITGDPELSLAGLTLVRNQEPEAERIRLGTYASPLFAGPGQDLKRRGTSGSLEQYAMRLLTNMPLPSMILAHTGARGETMDQAIRRLEAGVRQQGTPLAGQVFFLTSDDVRTKCRSWQFEDAAAELKLLGHTAQIIPLAEATPASQAWGIMAGTAVLDPVTLPRLVPGGMAEHLTSYAGIFDGHTYQTKMTAWLQAGAAASAGTVTEPMSIWTKFPHARFFVHYASGCTLLESFAQSMGSPLQAITIGDPLLAPWTRPQGLTLVNLSETTTNVRGAIEFAASPWPGPLAASSHIFYLLDGRTVMGAGQPPVLRINTIPLTDGYHELRAVVYAGQAVRHQGFTRQGFTVANRGRAIRVLNIASNQMISPKIPLEISYETDDTPSEIGVVLGGEVVQRQPHQEAGIYRLSPETLGAGPVELQLAAFYGGGEVVRSWPIPIRIERRQTSLPAAVSEHDGLVQSTSQWHLVRSLGNPESTVALSARIQIPGGEQAVAEQQAALAFDIKDDAHFSALAWNGARGGWELGELEAGVWKPEYSRGATLAPGESSTLLLKAQPDGGVIAEVDGLVLGASTRLALKGPFGFAVGSQPVQLSGLSAWDTLPGP